MSIGGLDRCPHSWYHFLSLYLSINPWADCEKLSASDIIRAVLSSSCDSFSPRSSTIWWAKFTSPVAVVTRSRRFSAPAFGPGMCLATVRDARPLDSPTGIVVIDRLFGEIFFPSFFGKITHIILLCRDFAIHRRTGLWRNSLWAVPACRDRWTDLPSSRLIRRYEKWKMKRKEGREFFYYYLYGEFITKIDWKRKTFGSR